MGRGVLRRNYILYFTSRKPVRSLQENVSYTKSGIHWNDKATPHTDQNIR